MTKAYDFVVIGAGAVGLTLALALTRKFPGQSIAVLDKEAALGRHASGRNSGVLHCGIYYDSRTLKAKVCSSGARRMKAYASERGIRFVEGGKLILATRQDQSATVEKLMRNAMESEIAAELVTRERQLELEPFSAPAEAAIHCPTTAVIDSKSVLAALRVDVEAAGGEIHLDTAFLGRDSENSIRTSAGMFRYGMLFNCAGAYADTVAKHFEVSQDQVLVPFKGIYWKLGPDAAARIRSNIYPVPDVSLPFLGVHVTRTIDDNVYLGPTAIPALGRENYGLIAGSHLGEATKILGELAAMYLANKGNFRRLAHIELGKYSKRNFLRSARALMPSLLESDLIPTEKVGIRPQLVNKSTRMLEMDYVIEQSGRTVHVLNAISPAFTSSFAFADVLLERTNFS
jgi:L-2-hydroxyglutarate oxidase LhgO